MTDLETISEEKLRKSFVEAFGESEREILCFFAPGRICLIGEHLDYNGGLVMPAAISMGIYGLLRKRSDNLVVLKSDSASLEGEFNIDSIEKQPDSQWVNYPLGVVVFLQKLGFQIGGFDFHVFSDLPVASGLSSSAAIEVLTAFALTQSFTGPKISLTELALLCMEVENEFVGLPCGIMDQFASAMGKPDRALVLNCGTLEYEYIPFETGDYELVIINTNKPRVLTETPFSERKLNCLDALGQLNQFKSIEGLAQADKADILKYIKDPMLQRRALYFSEENTRVMDSAMALKSGDIIEFGRLMWQSHEGLKTRYEVTGVELDAIVEASAEFKGCLGARMTGAGFGGCAIALVKNGRVADYETWVGGSYRDKFGFLPSFYKTKIGGGVSQIVLGDLNS